MTEKCVLAEERSLLTFYELHPGEFFALWNYLTDVKEARVLGSSGNDFSHAPGANTIYCRTTLHSNIKTKCAL